MSRNSILYDLNVVFFFTRETPVFERGISTSSWISKTLVKEGLQNFLLAKDRIRMTIKIIISKNIAVTPMNFMETLIQTSVSLQCV